MLLTTALMEDFQYTRAIVNFNIKMEEYEDK